MTVRILKYKSENQLYADFIALSKEALNKFGIKGWQVRQLKQPFKFNLIKPSVFVSVTANNQLGRQYRKRSKNDFSVIRENSEKKEVRIRFSATRRALATDTIVSYNGWDILSFIRAFQQSEGGIQYLSSLGYAQYRADETRQQDFINDSDDYEFLPSFECVYLYTDTWAEQVGEIDKVIGNFYNF
jgi:hypothetical protein